MFNVAARHQHYQKYMTLVALGKVELTRGNVICNGVCGNGSIAGHLG
jgi:hypothetical protein